MHRSQVWSDKKHATYANSKQDVSYLENVKQGANFTVHHNIIQINLGTALTDFHVMPIHDPTSSILASYTKQKLPIVT